MNQLTHEKETLMKVFKDNFIPTHKESLEEVQIEPLFKPLQDWVGDLRDGDCHYLERIYSRDWPCNKEGEK